MTIDLIKARLDTPGTQNVIHFNNAGASLMPRTVVEAVTGHIQREAEIGGYEAAAAARPALERFYGAVAQLLGCTPGEIAFTENATRAWDKAFFAIPLRPGDRILTSMSEYVSNHLAFLQVSQRTGAVVEVIPNDETGQISLGALRDAIDERVRLIALTHVPSTGGMVQPAAEVGRIAREAGALYLLDACQSVGQLPVNVEELGCDLLAATGRKYLRGPRGTGFLYVRKGALDRLAPIFLDQTAVSSVGQDRFEYRPDARRFENFEYTYAGKIGLGVAVDYLLSLGVENTWPRIQALGARLRSQLRAIPGVTITDTGREQCGIVTFTLAGRDLEQVSAALAAQRINVPVSPAGATPLDMAARGLPKVLRASVHYYNTEAELDRLCEALNDPS